MDIAIITLHKVINYGSALQTYATQEYLKKITSGNVFLIDYAYPNKFHKTHRAKCSFKKKVKINLGLAKRYLFWKRFSTISKFKSFWRNNYSLSLDSYSSIESIKNNPPKADLYITGSDQVWNVNCLCNDPVMFCQFAPKESKKISFGASFTTNQLPEKFKNDIRLWLNEYKAIGVREKSSLDILKDLQISDSINRINTCDPTLLLDSKDYHHLSENSEIKIEGDYILVYYLSYAYNPEPMISNMVSVLYEQYHCEVLVVCDKKLRYKGAYKQINGIGPCEFVYLHENAKYIITSSFHGTMFATIFRKPFLSVLPDTMNKDSRLVDFLCCIGLSDRGVHTNDFKYVVSFDNPFTNEVEEKLYNYINYSKDFLYNSIYGA